MRVCFFGTYEKSYPRNQILLKAMEKAGIDVIECHADIWENRKHKVSLLANKASLALLGLRLGWIYLLLSIRYLLTPNHDLVLVGYPGQLDAIMLKPWAWLRGKPIVLDAFVSVYDAAVHDRKLVKPGTFLAHLLFWLDRKSCLAAKRVVLDTNQQIKYFAKTFFLPSDGFVRIFAGAEDDLFYPHNPQQSSTNSNSACPFRVLFTGKFIPFHGIDVILEAAKILEDNAEIEFHIVGSGQLFEALKSNADGFGRPNVRVHGWVDYERLPERFRESDLCLGVFGDSDKLNRVIPNKIYQALAVGRPVVTSRSDAVDELLKDMESVYCVARQNAKELAHAILTLKADRKLAADLAKNGHDVFLKTSTIEQTSKRLRELFSSLRN